MVTTGTGLIAPPKTISGVVTDTEGNILEGAHVFYNNGKENIGIVTNQHGEFWLDQVPATAVVKFNYQEQELAKYFTYELPKKVVLDITNQLDGVYLTNKKSNLKWWIAGLATVLVVRHISKKNKTTNTKKSNKKGLGKPKKVKEVTL
ncbi:carboxypeptidase-like regulatory domain-containing protein [Mesoflavibacter sp. CH_XMU1404-2]|uniref:carboxypeptidase-like regulatory domain-containing protein n=1 Tax=Mesoflavibacter sp. CH_XMU1404-2 TaxID=3107766 RepID=UPI003009A224